MAREMPIEKTGFNRCFGLHRSGMASLMVSLQEFFFLLYVLKSLLFYLAYLNI